MRSASHNDEDQIMSTYKIEYGNSNTGYATAELVRGQRGGIRVTRHDGNPRRVTHDALSAALREYLSVGGTLSLLTTAGDSLVCQVLKS